MISPNNDIIFQFMYMICLYYKPSKYNKCKIKQLFEEIPFFIRDKEIMYNIIASNSITLHYHRANIIEYSYIIYKEYHKRINKNYLEFLEYKKHYHYLLYYNEEEEKREQKKRFIKIALLLIICVYFICISKIGLSS